MISRGAMEQCRNASWLQSLDDDALDQLKQNVSEAHAPAGSVLFAEGQPNNRLRILLEGTVAFFRTYPGREPELVTQITPPGLFGITTFFGGKPSRVEARAETDVWLLELDRPAFDNLSQQHPQVACQLARAVIGHLAERFDSLDQRVSAFLAQPPPSPRRASEWHQFRSKFFEEAPL